LYPKKTVWTGFADFVIGIVILLETWGDMSNIARVAESVTTSYVRADLGSGTYLAIVASFLVIVAGITTMVKVRATGRGAKVASSYAKPRTGLKGPFLLNEGTINREIGYDSPGVSVARTLT
jgi:hypothetical protein